MAFGTSAGWLKLLKGFQAMHVSSASGQEIGAARHMQVKTGLFTHGSNRMLTEHQMICEISEMTSAASSRPSIWVMQATRLQMQLRYEKKNMVPMRQLSHCGTASETSQDDRIEEWGKHAIVPCDE